MQIAKTTRTWAVEKTLSDADLFINPGGNALARFQLERNQELKRSRTAGDLALQTYNWPDEKTFSASFTF
jgi:hypothetical protein